MTEQGRVRVAVQIAPERGDYSAIRRAAIEAEALGVDAVFTWDHFFPLGRDRTGKHFEGWTTLGAWAESTSRAEIGALVSCAGYRNADLLADMARTVDHISGGRLILGVGAGFRDWEAEQYGYRFGSPGRRVRELGEALRRIEHRLAVLNPRPVRRIPVLVAAGGPRALRLVARYADIWHTLAGGDTVGEQSHRLDGHCHELGRDPAEIERAAFVAGDPWSTGPPLRRHGIGMFTVVTSGPDHDLTDLRRWLAWRDRENT